ncbi:hypothetical protein NDI79_06345 [Halogeometricum sp. S3BR5-2]|uniref:PGF-CTERM sorting domain-containing protein n=1 Tax=Halogeometricum luteum TaxID=2950537 RepID=A0ABU2FZ30_9EURY|nr:hypothetical protein [Halogeometricum sp. S3BR5-2]
MNDGPEFEGGAYETLADGRTDAWASTRDGEGYTCCRASTLDGPGSMDERVDHVLVGSGLTPTDARVVGADAESRLTTSVDGESRTLWPSDHAGVVTTLRAGATAEATEAAETETPATASPSDPDAGTVESGDGDSGGAGAPGTGTPPTQRSTETFADPPNGSSDAATNTEAGGAAADGESESETATDAPGFGPLAGLVGVLGGAAELLRRRDRRE